MIGMGTNLTNAQDLALRCFRFGSGYAEGVLLSRNRIAVNNKVIPVSPMTILYLIRADMLGFNKAGRLVVTDSGRRYLEMFP